MEKDGKLLTTNEVRREDSVDVVFEFYLKTTSIELEINAKFSKDNMDVFCTQNNDVKLNDWPLLNEGLNKLKFNIPKNLLNFGEYNLSIMVYIHQLMGLIDDEELQPKIKFFVHGKLSDSPSWQHPRKGAIAPIIHWVKS